MEQIGDHLPQESNPTAEEIVGTEEVVRELANPSSTTSSSSSSSLHDEIQHAEPVYVDEVEGEVEATDYVEAENHEVEGDSGEAHEYYEQEPLQEHNHVDEQEEEEHEHNGDGEQGEIIEQGHAISHRSNNNNNNNEEEEEHYNSNNTSNNRAQAAQQQNTSKSNSPPPPKGSEVFVGRLSKDVSESELQTVFSRIGPIYQVRLMVDPKTGDGRGFAFVRFHTPQHARMAVDQLDGSPLRGRSMGVVLSNDNQTLFVGHINKEWKYAELEMHLTEANVESIQHITLMQSPEELDRNRGFAFVEFNSHHAAAKAHGKMTRPDFRLGGASIKVDWAEPLNDPGEEVMSQVKSVYVCNLPPNAEESLVKGLFEEYGAIERVVLSKNLQSARRTDFAFVNYTDRESAIRAIKGRNGHLVEGRNLEVTLAKPVDKQKRTAQPPTPGMPLGMAPTAPGMPPRRGGSSRGGMSMRGGDRGGAHRGGSSLHGSRGRMDGEPPMGLPEGVMYIPIPSLPDHGMGHRGGDRHSNSGGRGGRGAMSHRGGDSRGPSRGGSHRGSNQSSSRGPSQNRDSRGGHDRRGGSGWPGDDESEGWDDDGNNDDWSGERPQGPPGSYNESNNRRSNSTGRNGRRNDSDSGSRKRPHPDSHNPTNQTPQRNSRPRVEGPPGWNASMGGGASPLILNSNSQGLVPPGAIQAAQAAAAQVAIAQIAPMIHQLQQTSFRSPTGAQLMMMPPGQTTSNYNTGYAAQYAQSGTQQATGSAAASQAAAYAGYPGYYAPYGYPQGYASAYAQYPAAYQQPAQMYPVYVAQQGTSSGMMPPGASGSRS